MALMLILTWEGKGVPTKYLDDRFTSLGFFNVILLILAFVIHGQDLEFMLLIGTKRIKVAILSDQHVIILEQIIEGGTKG